MKALSALLLFFIIGCVGLKKKMDSYLGQHETDLVTAWGMPDRTDTYGSKKVYIYSEARYASIQGTQYRYTTFFIDHKGTVTAYNVRESTVPVDRIAITFLAN
jgi:hypothetical protein